MPEPPPGEAALRKLALAFVGAEAYVGHLLAEAAAGNRATAAKLALERLAKLRLLEYRLPVLAAYKAENPEGKPDAVADLGGALAKRLDSGAKTAADGVRTSFARVTKDNLDEHLEQPVTAAIDKRGNHWQLGAWAEVHCTTYGRHATSRGVAHRVGEGGKVTISTGECGFCRDRSGDAVIGVDPLPPFHPSCSCVASAA